MKLEWMGEYRDVVESLMHYCNVYAGVYKKEFMKLENVAFSFSQVQVLEYLLENEERNENMSTIAARLGITRSNFTKIVKRLEDKGLVEKSANGSSKKELRVTVNERGRRLYSVYSEQILKFHFSPMFEKLAQVPPEYYPAISDFLNATRESPEPAEESGCA